MPAEIDVQRTDPMTEFRDKLTAKVRQDIADLLPADAVDQLVKKAVEDVFFQPRIVVENPDSYHQRKVEKPSWFVEAVAKEAEPILKRTVADFVAEHEAEIKQAVEQYLTPQNLTVLAVGALSSEISSAIHTLASEVRNYAR